MFYKKELVIAVIAYESERHLRSRDIHLTRCDFVQSLTLHFIIQNIELGVVHTPICL